MKPPSFSNVKILLNVERSRHALHHMRLEYGHASNPHITVGYSATNAIARRVRDEQID
jgi:hypothetical protein